MQNILPFNSTRKLHKNRASCIVLESDRASTPLIMTIVWTVAQGRHHRCNARAAANLGSFARVRRCACGAQRDRFPQSDPFLRRIIIHDEQSPGVAADGRRDAPPRRSPLPRSAVRVPITRRRHGRPAKHTNRLAHLPAKSAIIRAQRSNDRCWAV